jgi:hypothetical protein
MNQTYDRDHVDAVLKRVGAPKERRDEILDSIHFPIELDALQAALAPLGITHDALIDRMGGSP